MNVNEENLRPLSGTDNDPIALFMSTINKLYYLCNSVKPSLSKDHRLVQVETFNKMLFQKTHKDTYGQNGQLVKAEVNKLHSCSRENISLAGDAHNSIFRNLTYEKLNQQIEDLLKEHNFY